MPKKVILMVKCTVLLQKIIMNIHKTTKYGK